MLENDKSDLEVILSLDDVKEAYIQESMGFGYGCLKDGRPFCFGRANGPLEMEIYSNIEEYENGFEAEQFIKIID